MFDYRRTGLWLRRRGPRLLGELGLILVLVWGLEFYLTRDAARGPAPSFAAMTVAGEPFELSQLGGGPAVVYFWATWCPVCKAEQGTIETLARDYPLIGIAMQSGSAAEVAGFVNAEGIGFPTVADPDARIARLYGVYGVPAAFVLDGNGEIRFVTRGYTTGLGLRLRLWIAGLMH